MERSVDLYMPVYNRPEFTRIALETLREHSTWSLVRRCVLLDNWSEEPTSAVLKEFATNTPRTSVRRVRGTTVSRVIRVGTRRERHRSAPYMVKTDNDFLLPPGWLDVAVAAMETNKHVDVLGLREPMDPSCGRWGDLWSLGTEGPRITVPTSNPGGIFIARARSYHANSHRGARRQRGGALYTKNSLSSVFATLQREGKIQLGLLDPPLCGVSIDRLVIDSHPYPEAIGAYGVDRDEIASLVNHYNDVGHCRRRLVGGKLVDTSKDEPAP
ncbi:glycosyltransferase [Actinospongicola halichondriae]|uniref:glycosyltransferase n=1 Tax=Actinospongicola halichondriae TaxID=3236844 RepID=UPI003D37AC41